MRNVMAVVLVVVCVGCGDDGGGEIALDQLDDESARVQCAKIFECCDAAEQMAQFAFLNPPPTNEAECITAFQALFAGQFAQYQASITAGTMVYHGDRAGNCLNTVESASCSEFQSSFDNAD